MEASTAAPRPRIEVGRVINEVFSIYGRHVGPLVISAFVVFVIAGVIQGLLNEAGGWVLVALGVIVTMIARALYIGFVVKLVEDVKRDGERDLTVGDLFSSASHAIVPLIINGIIWGIAVGIGFFLLIIPGLILLTIWAVVQPAIVAERKGVIEAFGRSWELIRGQSWTVFGVIVVVFLIVLVASAILYAIGAAIGPVGAIIAAIIVSMFTAPIHALAASVMFFDLGGGDVAAPASAAAAPPPPPPAATA